MRVGLFASVHNVEILNECGYSEESIIKLFDNFKPAVICGEVRKSDYEATTGYKGPGEYNRYIFKYCLDRNIKFIPCDWFDESTIDANKKLTSSDLSTNSEFATIVRDYMCVGLQSPIPFNSEAFNAIVEKKQLIQKEYNSKIHKIVWEDRNNAILNNILSAIKANPTSDILIVFGAEHIYWLKNKLEELKDIQLIFPI